MLDNQSTLDWEEVLPAMMMLYNCHVHRAAGESPFFLTHLHSPRLPMFNLSRPTPLYSTDYVEHAFHNLEVSYKFARENLILAEDVRKAYFDKSIEKRDFCVGTKVLVKFPMVPKGVNPKFFKKWLGRLVAVKNVGNLNLLVCASPHSKPILVHVDQVKHVHPNHKLVKFDPNKGKDKSFGDTPIEEDLDVPAQHYFPEADFSAYIESASESEDESVTGEQAGEPANSPCFP